MVHPVKKLQAASHAGQPDYYGAAKKIIAGKTFNTPFCNTKGLLGYL